VLFTSPIFIFAFLPLVLTLYYLLPFKIKNLFLLFCSLFFYTWGEPKSIFILITLVIINYIFSFFVNRRLFLLLITVINLSYIYYFKYLLFSLAVFKINHNFSSIVMPLGISFVTFHLISYSVDIYRRKISPEKNPLNFALYIFLFPHLIAGPIVRFADIGPQIKKRSHNFDQVSLGIIRFISGLSKKVLLANTFALVADRIFSLFPQYLTSPLLLLALFSYSFQIYFDFSGYSDMAIGLAKMFGFNFNENFNYPYISNSIQDFWRRWHISLSSWFRDYLYIPLGGNRRGQLVTLINIVIVFALTGLWHGANWHFIFWGLYFGFFLILENIFLQSLLKKIFFPLRHIYVLTVVFFGWLLFRTESLSYALYLLKVIFGFVTPPVLAYQLTYFINSEFVFTVIISLLIVTPLGQKIFNQAPKLSKIFFLIFIFVLSLFRLSGDTYNPFIYFRF